MNTPPNTALDNLLKAPFWISSKGLKLKMAKYRPIAQEHIWRSPSCAGLPSNARLALLYLLAGSFTNTIGAYPIHPAIAAAEMELETPAEFTKLLQQLQDRGLVHFEGGIVIVATWFRHNTWESTLQGKVQKLAERVTSGSKLIQAGD